MKLFYVSIESLFVIVKFVTMRTFHPLFRSKFVHSSHVFPVSAHVPKKLSTSFTFDRFGVGSVNQLVSS